MVSKAQRHNKIIDIIRNGQVSSQQQISKILENDGVISTQATISRDLDEIGVVKVRLPTGESIYAIAESSSMPGVDGTLTKILKSYVLSITAVDRIIVIHTPTGCAQVTCAAIDNSRMSEIVGTIAGQDTIFIVVNPDADLEKFVNKLLGLSDISLS